ncbi:beta-lactamase family protein [Streptomyces triculaminicus]|uniref:Beta-lactamase family protein n=2 Tax=Streptomyces TaxID=1883 RepID=A0A939FRW1_9ACTN|nr:MULTISPECIES: serine hydrolase domain-containing protein [Streptomyces]MBO0655566.1 beta-lactamase family protein [Streptomyces triculaminicus]QSY50609.1 beta-lactamase family protein [Streptomyces griseocarneus]
MRLRLRSIVATAALAIGLAVQPGTATADSELDGKALQSALDKLTAAGAPAALAEVRVGGKTWSGASGVRDTRTKRPARPGDRYRVASVTKSMVAAVVMQLVDEGRLKLDDPVSQHLPGLLPYKEPITVRQLLNHTSGVPNYFDQLYAETGDKELEEMERNRFRYFPPRDLIKMATGKPLVSKPGTEFHYSNTNYLVIGQLIEKKTGRSLATELERRVFRPAGMKDTSYPAVNPYLAGPHVNGYHLVEGRPARDVTVYTPTVWGAAAGVVSTNADLNRFFKALSDGTLLSSARWAEMREFTVAPYALGVAPGGDLCPARPGEYLWGNTGNGFGYRTMSFSSPDGRRQLSFSWTLSVSEVDGPPAVSKAVQEMVVAAVGATCPKPAK